MLNFCVKRMYNMYIYSFNGKKLIFISALITIVITTLISVYCFAAGILQKESEYTEVPIIMYHHVLKEEKRQGKYVISPSEFESDIKFLKSKGYNTILIKDLINYVYDEIPLPENPIVITFDDGHESSYAYIYPILQKYNSKMVLSVVGEYSEEFSKTDESNISYSYVKWKQIKEMNDLGLVEIANHTYSLHSQGERMGIGKTKGEDTESYKKLIFNDISKLNSKLNEINNEKPVTFTYPFGRAPKDSYDVIKNIGFKASLSCEEGINKIIFNNPECLYMLKRYNRPHGISTEDFFGKIIN